MASRLYIILEFRIVLCMQTLAPPTAVEETEGLPQDTLVGEKEGMGFALGVVSKINVHSRLTSWMNY